MEHRYLSCWDYLPGEHHVNNDIKGHRNAKFTLDKPGKGKIM